MEEIRGSRVLILGYGREGQSTHHYLAKHRPDLTIGIADQKVVTPIHEAAATTEIYCGPQYLEKAHTFDTIIHSPGLVLSALPLQKVGHHTHITTATNLFFSLCPGKIIGVTGTKGKSTTSSLIAAIAGQHFPDVRWAGNIGKPMLDCLMGATTSSLFVLELSSFQLEDIRYSPHLSVLLNIVPEHLDHHGSFEAYVSAKGNIARFQREGDYFIHHLSSSYSAGLSKAKEFTYSETKTDAICYLDGEILYTTGNTPIVKLSEVALRGRGNILNLLAAVTAGLVLHVPIEKIKKAVTSFVSLEHRLELVGEFNGIRFVNDSLATIPEALINALDAFGDEVDTLIAGGFDRGLDFSVVGPALVNSKVRNLILFPTTGSKILDAARKNGLSASISCHFTESMEDAVAHAYASTKKGKVCLLSPASSSFNLFKDYKERGDKFKSLVKTLGSSEQVRTSSTL